MISSETIIQIKEAGDKIVQILSYNRFPFFISSYIKIMVKDILLHSEQSESLALKQLTKRFLHTLSIMNPDFDFLGHLNLDYDETKGYLNAIIYDADVIRSFIFGEYDIRKHSTKENPITLVTIDGIELPMQNVNGIPKSIDDALYWLEQKVLHDNESEGKSNTIYF